MYKDPWIVCPRYVEIQLPASKNKIALGQQWRLPESNMESLAVHPSYLSSTYEFPAGRTMVTWIATNPKGSVKSCNYQVYVKGEFGVVWCGVLWCAVVRCGAVRCGAVRCGAVRCGAVRCGAVRCGAVRCGAVRCGAVRCGAVRCGAVRCGAVRYGAVRCGLVWCNVV